MSTLYRIDMSYPEHTMFGKKLGKMWYSSSVYKLVDYSGYPHNGGKHTFYFKAEKQDVIAFLDIFDAEFGGSEETGWVRDQLSTTYDINLKYFRIQRKEI